jgi:hypothetical protein
MEKIMRLVRVAVVLALVAAPALAANKPSLPTATQGVWFPDDVEAIPSCKAYLVLKPNADRDAQINALVGSVVISRDQIHAVAEYGEGNFYTLRSITATGKGKWKAKTALTLDSNEDDGSGTAVPVNLALKGARLTVTETHANDKQPFVRKLVRCTVKLPKGY